MKILLLSFILLFTSCVLGQENCPTFTVEIGGTIIDYCGEPSGIFELSEIPDCGPWTSFYTVEFSTDGTPYPIEVASNANYINFPSSPINQQDIIILDACDGNLVATTFDLACAYGTIFCNGSADQTLYTAFFCLPEGTYIAIIGYLDPQYTISLSGGLEIDYYEPQTGCVTYTFGYPTFLELEDSPNDIPSNPLIKEPKVRYRKIVIESKGMFIRDEYTGVLYDIITRKIVN